MKNYSKKIIAGTLLSTMVIGFSSFFPVHAEDQIVDIKHATMEEEKYNLHLDGFADNNSSQQTSSDRYSSTDDKIIIRSQAGSPINETKINLTNNDTVQHTWAQNSIKAKQKVFPSYELTMNYNGNIPTYELWEVNGHLVTSTKDGIILEVEENHPLHGGYITRTSSHGHTDNNIIFVLPSKVYTPGTYTLKYMITDDESNLTKISNYIRETALTITIEEGDTNESFLDTDSNSSYFLRFPNSDIWGSSFSGSFNQTITHSFPEFVTITKDFSEEITPVDIDVTKNDISEWSLMDWTDIYNTTNDFSKYTPPLFGIFSNPIPNGNINHDNNSTITISGNIPEWKYEIKYWHQAALHLTVIERNKPKSLTPEARMDLFIWKYHAENAPIGNILTNDVFTFTTPDGTTKELNNSFADYNVEFFDTEKYEKYFVMKNGDATSNGEITYTAESIDALEGTTHKIGKYRLCEKKNPESCTEKVDIYYLILRAGYMQIMVWPIAFDDYETIKEGAPTTKIDIIANDLYHTHDGSEWWATMLDRIGLDLISEMNYLWDNPNVVIEDGIATINTKDFKPGEYNLGKYQICYNAEEDLVNGYRAYKSCDEANIILQVTEGEKKPNPTTPTTTTTTTTTTTGGGGYTPTTNFSAPIINEKCVAIIKNIDDPRLREYLIDTLKVSEIDPLDRALTRAEFSKLIANSAKFDIENADLGWLDGFVDLDKDADYAPYIAYVLSRGIMHGQEMEEGRSFRPDDTINRFEASKVLSRLILIDEDTELPKEEEIKTFADIHSFSSLAPYAEYSYQKCLLHGKNTLNGQPIDGTERRFAPFDYITLGETGKILYNMTHEMSEEI